MNKGVHLNTRSARKGFTLLELLLVIVIIAILAALLLPALEKARSRSRQVECLSQLKNTGLAFHGFAHEHQDEFTFQVPMGLGGTMELVQAGANMGQNNPYTFRHFQALSNELEVPKVLACPSDSRLPATTFTQFANENLSYFVAVTANYFRPDTILAGDRNLLASDGSSGSVLSLGGGVDAQWTAACHEYQGNILYADAHVERTIQETLKAALSRANFVSAWIPFATPRPGVLPDPTTTPPASSPPGSSGGGGGGGSGGSSDGSPLGGLNGGLAVLQNFFHPPSTDGRPPSTPVATPPPAIDSPPLATVPSARAPAPAPDLPPPVVAPAPMKPATNKVAAKAPPPAQVEPPVAKPAPAAPLVEPAPPLTLFMVIAKPERCWYCWAIIVTLAVITAILLGMEVRRRRALRKMLSAPPP